MQVELGALCGDVPGYKGLPCTQDCRIGTFRAMKHDVDAPQASGQVSSDVSTRFEAVFKLMVEEIFIVNTVPGISG